MSRTIRTWQINSVSKDSSLGAEAMGRKWEGWLLATPKLTHLVTLEHLPFLLQCADKRWKLVPVDSLFQLIWSFGIVFLWASFFRFRRVSLTASHRKTVMSNSCCFKLLCNKEESWRRIRNGPKRNLISWRKMEPVLVVLSVQWSF